MRTLISRDRSFCQRTISQKAETETFFFNEENRNNPKRTDSRFAFIRSQK